MRWAGYNAKFIHSFPGAPELFESVQMAVPDYQALMLPLLRRLANEPTPVPVRRFVDSVADEFRLTEEERALRIPSGSENLLTNRLAWARTYLGKAGLLVSPRHGLVQISERGRKILEGKPEKIDERFLRQFPEFTDWMARSQRPRDQALNHSNASRPRQPDIQPLEQDAEEHTPRERIDNAKQELESALQEDLRQRIRSMAPSDFEDLILRLLLAMGYGQGIDEMARTRRQR